MSEYWWRSWHGAPMDHKWPVIAARAGVKAGVVSAIAWALIDYASQQPNRGDVDGFDAETYAVYSGFTIEEVEKVIQVMKDKGVIVNGRLANWEKRQPKREDDSRERVRKYREMKRNVTQCNAPDTDTESDTDRENNNPPLSPEIELYREVTGLVPDYMHEDEVKRNIESVRQKHDQPPRAVLLDIMREKYALWCTAKTADGKPYNPSNPKWLEWCITGYIPQPPQNGKTRSKPLPKGL